MSGLANAVPLDLNSLCHAGGAFLPTPCGPFSSCHRCYHLGQRDQSCSDACEAVGSSCDSAGTAALGSLGDMSSCLDAADALNLPYELTGTYVGENIGCSHIDDGPGNQWIQRLVDTRKATTCDAKDGGRQRICACDLKDGPESAPTLLSDDKGSTCIDLLGDGGCDVFALVEESLALLPDARDCVGEIADEKGAEWTLVRCGSDRAAKFGRQFGRYVSDVKGSGVLEQYSATCAPLDLSSIEAFARPASERGGLGYDLSQYDQTDCASVAAGEVCEVKCHNGYASAKFECPAGNVDRTQQPLASDLPRCFSNSFLGGDPSLYGVPTSDSLRVRAVAERPGKLWVVVADAREKMLTTANDVKGCKEPQCAACRLDGVATEDAFYHVLEKCSLVEGAAYRIHFYVSSEEDEDGGSIATYDFEVPNVACPIAMEPNGTAKQNGRYFWGSCHYVADGLESCSDFCQNKLSGASCDIGGILSVGSCAQSEQSCVQLVEAMSLPFDEKQGTFGDDSSGCTWLHGGGGGANAEFWVQRFVKDRDTSIPTECDEVNGSNIRHRICSCEIPDSFALEFALRPRKLLSVKTGLLLEGVYSWSLQNNAAALREIERVFLDLTGAAMGDASVRVIEDGTTDVDVCEALIPPPKLPGTRRLFEVNSQVWVYVGANDGGSANQIQMNILNAVNNGELAKRASEALTNNGVQVSGITVAGTTPEPTQAPTVQPTSKPTISLPPTAAPSNKPTDAPTPVPSRVPSATPSNRPTSLPLSSFRYESTGHFIQELLLKPSTILAEEGQSSFERTVESLTPLFSVHMERSGGNGMIDTFATLVSQEIIVSEDADPPNGGQKFRGLLRRLKGGRRAQDEPIDPPLRVRMEYIIQYVSPEIDVSGYPLLYIEYLSWGENRTVLEEKLLEKGVPIVPGSASEVVFAEDFESPSTKPDPESTAPLQVEGGSGNGTAAIVGAVVGVVCGAVLALGVFVYLRRKRRKEQENIPVAHAVAVAESSTGQEPREEFIVEAFAVEDESSSSKLEGSSTHSESEEQVESARSYDVVSPPEPQTGSEFMRTEHATLGGEVAAEVVGGDGVVGANSKRDRVRANIRESEGEGEASLYSQKMAMKERRTGRPQSSEAAETVGLKDQKRMKKHRRIASGEASGHSETASRVSRVVESTNRPMPKGPEIVSNLARV